MKKQPDQARALRQARQTLGMTTDQLADALGKSTATLNAWLSPRTSQKHRTMPPSSRLLLSHILAAKKRK